MSGLSHEQIDMIRKLKDMIICEQCPLDWPYIVGTNLAQLNSKLSMDRVIPFTASTTSCTSKKHHKYHARAIVYKGSAETGTHSSHREFLAEGESGTGVLGALENLWVMILEDAH
jgi:hypothetical protein